MVFYEGYKIYDILLIFLRPYSILRRLQNPLNFMELRNS